MPYIIHRIQKLHSIKHEKNHIERDENYQTKNLNLINTAKTSQNIQMIPRIEIQDRDIRETYKARKNAVLSIEGIYTASPSFFENKPKFMIIDFFRDCLEWHKKTYGDKLISAVIHFDETTPHMHVMSIPEKDGKLNAKSIIGDKQLMAKRQTDIANEIGAKYDLSRGQENDRSKQHIDQIRYHREQLEYIDRCQTAKDDMQETRQDYLDEQQERIYNEQERLSKAWIEIKQYRDNLEEAKAIIDNMTLNKAYEIIKQYQEQNKDQDER